MSDTSPGPIGIFDSGYGGLTVFRKIERLLPNYDFIYLGDNARAPYGPRGFETIYEYTLQAVQELFSRGCQLVILACNTSSARALRNIQQIDLPKGPEHRRVLGIIRPTTELIGNLSKSKHVGILATEGTVKSESYPIEIAKFFPRLEVSQQACPMWVPLIENGEHESEGADYFVKKYLEQLIEKDPMIDTILLGCTHYPLLLKKINEDLPAMIKIVRQGELVATSLQDYLSRHPELASICSKKGSRQFYTTGDPEIFSNKAKQFIGKEISVDRLVLS
ncbi:MAG: glutamate racemase [Saprospiraceae bacterium]|nr:glutamate racemase [Saprospiraceae bacterium]